MSAAGELRPLELAVEDRGGRGRPVLFVHGFGHHRGVWHDVALALGSSVRPIRIDLRGHGESEWSISGAYGLDDYADDIERCLGGLGVSNVAVVAHSLGGNAATLALARTTVSVERLVLVDTGPSLSQAGVQQVAAGAATATRSFTDLDEYRALLELTYPLAQPAALDRLARGAVVTRPDGRLEQRLDPAVLGGPIEVEAMAALEERLWSALGRVQCPTLVARGATSAMLTADAAERMLAVLPAGSRLETVARAGHSVMLDAPGELAARVAEFLGVAQSATVERWSRTASSQAALFSS